MCLPPRPTPWRRLPALGIDQGNLSVTREAPAWFHPGRSGSLKLGPKVTLGTFGELHPDVLAKLGVDAPLAGFELYLDAIPAAKRKIPDQAGARRLGPAGGEAGFRLPAR